MRGRGELDAGADISALATSRMAAIQGGMLLSQIRRSSVPFRQAVSTVIDHIESHGARSA
jgi:TetR/AcrR family transcriptional repressor of nem operon